MSLLRTTIYMCLMQLSDVWASIFKMKLSSFVELECSHGVFQEIVFRFVNYC